MMHMKPTLYTDSVLASTLTPAEPHGSDETLPYFRGLLLPLQVFQTPPQDSHAVSSFWLRGLPGALSLVRGEALLVRPC